MSGYEKLPQLVGLKGEGATAKTDSARAAFASTCRTYTLMTAATTR